MDGTPFDQAVARRRARELTRARHRAYYQANRDAIAVKRRAYYTANREKIRAYQRDYYYRVTRHRR
jgi:hypothetical protein